MHKILVPVDGSPSSDHAVQHVIALKRTGLAVEVRLLHVSQAHLPQGVPESAKSGLGERLEQDAAEHAFAPAKRLLGEAGMPFSTHLVAGDPAQEIALHADVHGCTEIVMGTRGLGPIKSLVIGSVTTKVLHLARIPVTLVK